jgi:hypothetical protein
MGQNSMPPKCVGEKYTPQNSNPFHIFFLYGCVSNWGTTQKLKAKSQTCFQPWDLKW